MLETLTESDEPLVGKGCSTSRCFAGEYETNHEMKEWGKETATLIVPSRTSGKPER